MTISELFSIVLWLAGFALIMYAIYYVIGLLAIPGRNIILAIFAIIGLLILVKHFLPMLGVSV